MTDLINHPPHYTSHPSGVECIQITEHMSFNLGNAVKYIWRAGLKDMHSITDDLEKAKWYIDRELFRLNNQMDKSIENVEDIAKKFAPKK